MQYLENLEAGDKIELIPLAQQQNSDGKIYLSKIQDIQENGEMEILMPMEKGKIILLMVNSRYMVRFYTRSGIFQGECIITKRYRDEKKFFLGIQLLSRLTKKQRREYYRLECSQEVEFRVMTGTEAAVREKIRNNRFEDPKEKERYVNYILDLDQKAEWIPANMMDISGGGIRVKTQKREDMEKHLMFRVNLYAEGQIKQVELECYAVSIENMMNEPRMMEMRCRFTHITNQKQEMIVKYIFEQQRKQRALK